MFVFGLCVCFRFVCLFSVCVFVFGLCVVFAFLCNDYLDLFLRSSAPCLCFLFVCPSLLGFPLNISRKIRMFQV